MEEQWYVDRYKLRKLRQEHPNWGRRELARRIGRSLSWVKKWIRRLREASPDDDEVLKGRSRARKQPPPKTAPEVEQRILEIRDEPPENLRRVPGPLAILYYLHRDENLKAQGYHLPRSTRTIWELLDRNQRIFRRKPREPEPEERPEPGVEWGIDFKDVTTVPAEPVGKKQHVVEILNIVDHGSSAVVDGIPRDDYTAETALRTLADVLQDQGCPQRIRMDRDTRWVGSWKATDFPSPTLCFLMCLGITPVICPPHKPEKNPFVERYHKNSKYECILVECPGDLPKTIAVDATYRQHYNYERPNQAITCGNQPPRIAFPEPPQLPKVSDRINPDRWLSQIHGDLYVRKVDSGGRIQIGKHRYYVKKDLRGRRVVLQVDAVNQEFIVKLDKKLIKRLAIKGLHKQDMDFAAYLEMMCKEALSAWQTALRRKFRYVQ